MAGVGAYLNDVDPIPEGELELTEIEWDVLYVAVTELDGKLSVNPLYAALKDAGVAFSHRNLRKLAEQLIAEGWAIEQTSSTDPRRCTNALIEAVTERFDQNSVCHAPQAGCFESVTRVSHNA